VGPIEGPRRVRHRVSRNAKLRGPMTFGSSRGKEVSERPFAARYGRLRRSSDEVGIAPGAKGAGDRRGIDNRTKATCGGSRQPSRA
jgi:hypothetical protein